MDSTIDPRTVVDLHSTLDQGSPLPSFILAEVRSRDDKTDIVIETVTAQVRLTHSGSPSSQLDNSVVLAAPSTPVTTIYPNVYLDES